MGRPPKLTPQQQKEARRRAQGATLKELAKSYNVGRTTISRLAMMPAPVDNLSGASPAVATRARRRSRSTRDFFALEPQTPRR
jgi:hypothetical protein